MKKKLLLLLMAFAALASPKISAKEFYSGYLRFETVGDEECILLGFTDSFDPSKIVWSFDLQE